MILFGTRLFTVLFHELGHAIPAILFSQRQVTVYIGSYGDPTKSIKCSIGQLDIWFKYNPFSWKRGMCVPSDDDIPLDKQILYIICGPLASLLIALIACYYLFLYDSENDLKIILLGFLLSSGFDFLANIIPMHAPVQLYDGRITYNDGYQLRQLFRYKKFPKEYLRAIKLYNKKLFIQAADLFDDLLNRNVENEEVYRLSIAANINVGRYNRAIELFTALEKKYEMNADDYCNLGLIKNHLDQREESLNAFDTSLQLNPDNYYTLNNKGCILTLWNKFEEAIPYLDKAISINPKTAYAYNNRGFAKIKLGDRNGGLADIQQSLEIDPGNAYAIRNVGIYHQNEGNKQEALRYFLKAREIDPNTYLLNELIAEVNQ